MNEVERLVVSTPFVKDPTLPEKIRQVELQNTKITTRYEAMVQKMQQLERM